MKVLEPFCVKPQAQFTLINTVQLYCYEDTRVMKSFVPILKVGIIICAIETHFFLTKFGDSHRHSDMGGAFLTRPSFTGIKREPSRMASSIS